MNLQLDRYLGTIGTASGFCAWVQLNYPLIKGFMGEVAFWIGVILALWALLERLKKLWLNRPSGSTE
jgi:hypothetical protein